MSRGVFVVSVVLFGVASGNLPALAAMTCWASIILVMTRSRNADRSTRNL